VGLFFTVVRERRQPILKNELIRSALREAIKVVREQYLFIIDGWVLLSDHLRAIWTLPASDADFSTRRFRSILLNLGFLYQ
jgi:putative transposase